MSSTSSVGEFDLIDILLQSIPSHLRQDGHLLVGAGDDAAALSSLVCPVITTDAQHESVHFYRHWLSPRDLGYKAVMVCLSDLAASYAFPRGLFINLGVPAGINHEYLCQLYRGVGSALEACGGQLGGGNISSSERLSIDLFAVGEGYAPMPQRGHAHVGQIVCATGVLGQARGALHGLLHGNEVAPELLQAFVAPRARFDAAAVLNRCGVRTVMDISDGLAGDCSKIARASGVSIQLAPEHFVVPAALQRYALENNREPREFIIGGGEDYELLFTCDEHQLGQICELLPDVMIVGHVVPEGDTPVIGGAVSSYIHGTGWTP
ncbi:thiamine-phosphate kinase [Desulfurispira natronophila]|uniref:Thiamine-monophosphate kinase n=1 Tax=Desulfurispira natronophila TaxID=682562 RepID=A0A7W8DFU0_9BACT|nr:thiamine-monophosphate kinase [Desulfurispira natronophila]